MVVPVVVAAAAALVTQVAIGDSGDVLVPVALAAAAGLVVGLIAAWVAERRSSTILGVGDLAKLTSVPNLAVVPRHAIGASRPDDVAMFRDPNSIEAEGYRVLRTALEFVTRTSADGDSDGDGPGPIVLITSPRPGEGKSSVAANLAAATAMAGRRVVLVDGDLRKPQVHRLFRVKNDEGLSSVLRGDATLGDAVQRLDVVDGFALLSAGPPPPDPAELLANERLELTLQALAQAADLVLVDAPPLLAVTDPTMIVQHCDAVLMVATAGFSSRTRVGRGDAPSRCGERQRGGHRVVAARRSGAGHPHLPLCAQRRPVELVGHPEHGRRRAHGSPTTMPTVTPRSRPTPRDSRGGAGVGRRSDQPRGASGVARLGRRRAHRCHVDRQAVGAHRPVDHRRLADSPYRRLSATTPHAAASDTGIATATATSAGAVVGSIAPVRATATAAIPPISPIDQTHRQAQRPEHRTRTAPRARAARKRTRRRRSPTRCPVAP